VARRLRAGDAIVDFTSAAVTRPRVHSAHSTLAARASPSTSPTRSSTCSGAARGITGQVVWTERPPRQLGARRNGDGPWHERRRRLRRGGRRSERP
jgi:hypothetical protein